MFTTFCFPASGVSIPHMLLSRQVHGQARVLWAPDIQGALVQAQARQGKSAADGQAVLAILFYSRSAFPVYGCALAYSNAF